MLSLKWKITGEAKYADAGVCVLMAWANKCKVIRGDPNAQLIALNGYQHWPRFGPLSAESPRSA